MYLKKLLGERHGKESKKYLRLILMNDKSLQMFKLGNKYLKHVFQVTWSSLLGVTCSFWPNLGVAKINVFSFRSEFVVISYKSPG